LINNQLFKRVLSSNTKGTIVVYPVPFLCFSKEKNQKKGVLFQGVFWHCPKTRNALLNFLQGFKNSLHKALLTLVKKEEMLPYSLWFSL